MEEFLKKIKENFEIGEPIFTNEILALFNYEKQKTMWLLKKSIDNGDIKKIEEVHTSFQNMKKKIYDI